MVIKRFNGKLPLFVIRMLLINVIFVLEPIGSNLFSQNIPTLNDKVYDLFWNDLLDPESNSYPSITATVELEERGKVLIVNPGGSFQLPAIQKKIQIVDEEQLCPIIPQNGDLIFFEVGEVIFFQQEDTVFGRVPLKIRQLKNFGKKCYEVPHDYPLEPNRADKEKLFTYPVFICK